MQILAGDQFPRPIQQDAQHLESLWDQLQSQSVFEKFLSAQTNFVGAKAHNFWWAPVVAALLLAFAAFNVWYLVRTRLVRSPLA